MPKYKLCPRCELNYIPVDEEYCGVCKAELKIGPQLMFAVDDDEEVQEKLCPVCKINYIPVDSDMCDTCREATPFPEEKEHLDEDDDTSWKDYLDEDEKDEIIEKENSEETISLSQLEEEEAAQLFDDEEEFLDEDEDEEEAPPEEEEIDDFEIIPFDETEYEEDEEEDEEEEEGDDFGDDEDDFDLDKKPSKSSKKK